MRRIALAAVFLSAVSGASLAQAVPPDPVPGVKPNANPCSEEVSASLQKLRKSSWFRMDTRMITENGPTTMQIDYVLPDRMHQTVKVEVTKVQSELVLIGDKAWSKQGDSGWKPLPPDVTGQLKTQMEETVLQQQTDVGNYACKGRTQVEGREVLSYKLDNEPAKGASAPESQTFRMFYVDPLTGLPVSNVLLAPGYETKPLFKTAYSFPVDMKIDEPKDIAPAEPPKSDPGK